MPVRLICRRSEHVWNNFDPFVFVTGIIKSVVEAVFFLGVAFFFKLIAVYNIKQKQV